MVFTVNVIIYFIVQWLKWERQWKKPSDWHKGQKNNFSKKKKINKKRTLATMGGSSIKSAKDRHYLFGILTIFILCQLIYCCDAYFYSEKSSGSGSGEDKNCFCEVNIYTCTFFARLFVFFFDKICARVSYSN